MATLLALPVLVVMLILQSAILSRMTLLHGTTDLVLLAVIAWSLQKRVQTAWLWGIIGGLLVTIASNLPPGVSLASYLLAVGMALVLRQRVWQVPILSMFVATILGTLIIQGLAYLVLRLNGLPLPVLTVINQITLPSILLNLLVAIPIFAIMSDFARWIYPEELEV